MERVRHITIDLSKITDAKQLHLLLMEQLNLPDWYGCNWDAFWDAITGLEPMPEFLSFAGWSILKMRLPNDAKLMKECFDRMATELAEIAPICEYL